MTFAIIFSFLTRPLFANSGSRDSEERELSGEGLAKFIVGCAGVACAAGSVVASIYTNIEQQDIEQPAEENKSYGSVKSEEVNTIKREIIKKSKKDHFDITRNIAKKLTDTFGDYKDISNESFSMRDAEKYLDIIQEYYFSTHFFLPGKVSQLRDYFKSYDEVNACTFKHNFCWFSDQLLYSPRHAKYKESIKVIDEFSKLALLGIEKRRTELRNFQEIMDNPNLGIEKKRTEMRKILEIIDKN